jgi:hypothetical protein
MGGARSRRRRLLATTGALLALAGLLAGSPAGAQTLPVQTPSVQSLPAPAASSLAPCELHIWPAATTHTTFQGWVRAGAVDGARRGVNGYPDLHAEALDAQQQARLLATIDWRGAFNDPALVVVFHVPPTGSADDRTRTSRLVAQSSAPCYRELIIVSSIIESEVFSETSVRILALRKKFDGADAAPVNFSSMSQEKIAFSDLDKAAPDANARMDAAVQAAFVSAAKKFAVMQSFH